MSRNIVVYGQPNCPGCEYAKSWLEQRKVPFTYYSIGTDVTRQNFLLAYPTVRSVPLIIFNGIPLKNGIKDLQDSIL